MLRGGIVKNPLNQVVAILVTCDVNQGDASAIAAAFTNAVEVSTQKIPSANFEALLNYLRRKLIGAVFSGISNDMINGPAPIGGGPVFTYVLNTPVSELAVCHDVDICENFFDARPLSRYH